MFILTSQDGLSTGILGINSIMQVIPMPSLSVDADPEAEPVIEHGIFVNGMPFGKFKTVESATKVIEKVTSRLTHILGKGTDSSVKLLYRVPEDTD